MNSITLISDIAKSKGQNHLLAISERASLSEAVTDVLVDRGDTHVHHALAKNSGARFSESGFAALVTDVETAMSRGNFPLAEALLQSYQFTSHEEQVGVNRVLDAFEFESGQDKP